MQPSAPRTTSLPTREAQQKPTRSNPERPPTTYLFGAFGGLVLGLLSAYFFRRASDENLEGPQPIQTAQMFGVALALLTVLRQIAEMGKPPKKRGRG